MTHPSFPPIVRTVTVKAAPDEAFRRFTAEMDRWWPLASHSVGGARAEGITFEGHVGGQIVERIRDGERSVWGCVTHWEPPHRVAFTWHPGGDPATAQDIEVRFEPVGPRTRVTLTHSGFERLGEKAARAHRGYPIGWTYVLGLYAERRGLGLILLTGVTRVLMGILSAKEKWTRARAER